MLLQDLYDIIDVGKSKKTTTRDLERRSRQHLPLNEVLQPPARHRYPYGSLTTCKHPFSHSCPPGSIVGHQMLLNLLGKTERKCRKFLRKQGLWIRKNKRGGFTSSKESVARRDRPSPRSGWASSWRRWPGSAGSDRPAIAAGCGSKEGAQLPYQPAVPVGKGAPAATAKVPIPAGARVAAAADGKWEQQAGSELWHCASGVLNWGWVNFVWPVG